MDKKLRIAVVGAGFFGQKHIDVLSRLANAELIAVCDINETLDREVREKYGCAFYSDHHTMYKEERLDAVSICVSEAFHMAPAVDAANAGLDILLEKPMAQNLEEAIAIKQAVDRNGTRLMVAHVCEFDGRYYYTSQAIKEGKLGEIISMYFKRSSTHSLAKTYQGKVSFFHYMGVHDIEAMLLFAQPARPVKVYSQWVSKKNKSFNSQDTVFNTFTFDNGIVAVTQICWALPDNPALGFVVCGEVVGTKGVSYIDIKNQGVELFSETGVSYPDITYWPEYFGRTEGKVRDEIQHFVGRTLSGEEYLVDTKIALEAIRVIDACFESLKTQQAVNIKGD